MYSNKLSHKGVKRMVRVAVLLLIVLFATESRLCFAAQTNQSRAKKTARKPQTKSGKKLAAKKSKVWSSLKGSRSSLDRQNAEAKRRDLTFAEDDEEIKFLKKNKFLVDLPRNGRLRIDKRLHKSHRYCRPWTRIFLLDLAEDFKKDFPKSKNKLQINSAIRCLEYQHRLQRRNSNASSRSSHPTGATVDLAKKGLTKGELRWLRTQLRTLEASRYLEATEEHRQPCFHIMVFESYVKSRPRRT